MVSLADRKKIAEWVLNTNDEILLDKIKTLTLSKAKAINDLIIDYNKEIDEAIVRIESGKFKTHQEVEALLNTWESK